MMKLTKYQHTGFSKQSYCSFPQACGTAGHVREPVLAVGCWDSKFLSGVGTIRKQMTAPRSTITITMTVTVIATITTTVLSIIITAAAATTTATTTTATTPTTTTTTTTTTTITTTTTSSLKELFLPTPNGRTLASLESMPYSS